MQPKAAGWPHPQEQARKCDDTQAVHRETVASSCARLLSSSTVTMAGCTEWGLVTSIQGLVSLGDLGPFPKATALPRAQRVSWEASVSSSPLGERSHIERQLGAGPHTPQIPDGVPLSLATEPPLSGSCKYRTARE